MTKTCQNCQQSFEITEQDQSQYDYFHVPIPTFCPDCRQQRRLAWRNERTLYRRKCDATGKDIISVFSPISPTQSSAASQKPLTVYENEYWYSDKWNALQYGRDFDPNRPFFEQFQELLHTVPQLARSAVGNQNCDFVNQCGWCKNCYLIFEADFNENCLYANNIYDSRFTMDCLVVTNCELCYECIDCEDCYNLKFSQNCKNCSDSWFLKNCIGCRNCYGCVNLRNKSFYFLNEKCSKEEYEKKLSQLHLKTYADLATARENFLQFAKKYPQKYMQGVQNEDVTGDYMFNNQRCYSCFDVNHCQDCKYIYNCRYMKKCHDITVFGSIKGAEFCYEVHETGDSVRNIFFSDQIWTGCYDIYYSKLCINNCHDLFGCVGLKHSSYCILNKQYSAEEYKKLKDRIIEHMKKNNEYSQFFPAGLSPFAYNETVAQYYFPLTKDQALQKGFKWKDPDPKEYLKQTYTVAIDIKNVPDTIVNEILTCSECGKNFKIVPEELRLYRKSNLPIPQKCPDCRHRSRFHLRNPRKLYDRKCQKCQMEIKTTFSPDKPDIVYCEKCYLEAMV